MTDNQTSDRETLIAFRMEQAREALAGAELLSREGLWRSCVNRLYYACFYAVSTGLVSRELGIFYNRLFEGRHEGDYADFVRFDEAQVRPWIEEARNFIGAVESVVVPGDAS